MKRPIFILSFLITAIVLPVALSSCNKTDCNGDLDGMWQLIAWNSPKGESVATKDSMIFYSFQLQMMRFQKLTGYPKVDKLSSFEKYDNSIRIYNTISYSHNGHDSILDIKVLHPVGVPENGIMNIIKLSPRELVLESSTNGTLKFRKY